MKTFTAALAVLFVASLCYQVSSVPLSVDNFSPYCKNFITNPLPFHIVKSYSLTTSFRPAVIFTTVKDKAVCANPKEKWVQDLMNHLKDREYYE